ncbi:MFS transporter [Amycolatopsis sp. WAC 04182]|uniref:MFS transporter n=1 Tax=Amycolatopsis sp. WAC 04182 TaxID=2203198 RepID=UPI000F766F39|nr:MFS transporter [Amycolatopsis sp. WAC 04182]RSN63565.1 MFS transporter [Amycolatopsis sp. WAC 04182]
MRKTMAPLLLAVLVVFSAQQLITPILAPLSRRLDLTESQLGLVITTAAVALTIASTLWGRALDRIGVRKVLLAGLVLATLGLTGFAVASALGLAEVLSSSSVLAVMLATRSLLFGAGIAALPVAALAAAAAATSDEADRTKAVGLVGAVQGISLVLGPALGGALAVVSLTLPLYLAPALTALLAIWVFATASRTPHVRPDGPRAAGVKPWEARLWPFFAIGFLLYLSLGLVQVITGFLIADRLHLAPEETAGSVGVALFAAGLVLVAVQGAVVPKLAWPSVRLMRVGAPIAVAGLLLLAIAGQLWSITAAFAVLALGLGLALPGFAAAPTLMVGPEQQGSVAGLVNATTGATFIVGPLLGTALYEAEPVVPIFAAAGAAGGALLLALFSPAARRLGSRDEVAAAN